MINPDEITSYNLKTPQLQKTLIFWLLVAGKTAKVIAKAQEQVFNELESLWARDYSGSIPKPFQLIKDLCERRKGSEWLAKILKKNGIGCYKVKAQGMIQLAHAELDLCTCKPEDLEQISGIGMKTSRCFILHSRENTDCAGLDVHILSFLRDIGCKDIPDSTPGSAKKYREIEAKFLKICHKVERTPAYLDLLVWRIYSKHTHLKRTLIDVIHHLV